MTPTGDSPAEPASGDTPLTTTYILVIVVEAIVIALLWMFGRIYS